MKSNEDYLKQLFCDTLLKSLNGCSVMIAVKDAQYAVNAFNEQFQSTEILEPLDVNSIKVWHPNQEETILDELIKQRGLRFKGCTRKTSLDMIPSVNLGKFPYWLCINSDNTITIQTRIPK